MKVLRTLAVLALLGACRDSSSPAPAPPPPPPPPPDRIVAGVNLTLLFAPPTDPEILTILTEWTARAPAAAGVVELRAEDIPLGLGQARLQIVSHEVDGNSHVGAILTPAGAQARSLPILLFAHGGDHGANVEEALNILPLIMGDMLNRFVYVVPAFRAEPLSYKGTSYLAEGSPSPWDRDVDDAMALVSVTAQTVAAADPNRIAVVGASRGGCVGLLMGIRDPRIDLVSEFAGPTDFFGPFVQRAVEDALLGNPPNLPGADFLNATLVQPLKNGALTIAAARLELLRRSPVYFANRLPALQVHHGTADNVVPVTEAQRLIAVMEGLGRRPPQFESYIYEGADHQTLLYQPLSIGRLRTFLARLLD
jgi:dipeptidyl aminopeptidase/acylaminoacyl peptidase